MSVKQISVFIENKTGQLAEATRVLAEKKINLRALSIADTQDFGILRIITEDPESAVAKLKEADYVTAVTDVLAVAITDEPGSLAKILSLLADASVSVEYTYAFTSRKVGEAYMIFRVDDYAAAEAALSAAGVKVAVQNEIFA